MFSELKPYDPHEREEGARIIDWFGTGMATLLLVVLSGLVSLGCWTPASNDLKKLKGVKKTGIYHIEVRASRADDNDQV